MGISKEKSEAQNVMILSSSKFVSPTNVYRAPSPPNRFQTIPPSLFLSNINSHMQHNGNLNLFPHSLDHSFAVCFFLQEVTYRIKLFPLIPLYPARLASIHFFGLFLFKDDTSCVVVVAVANNPLPGPFILPYPPN